MHGARGFTLLELLIAIALFALLGVATWRLLDGVLRADQAVRAQTEHLRRLDRALWQLERDLLQAVPRPVRDADGQPLAAFLAAPATDVQADLEFTRGGARPPAELPRATLQRVAWRWHEGRLERLRWAALDRRADGKPQRQEALADVEALHWRYLGEDGQWHRQWPPQGRATVPGEADRSLPRAVELQLRVPRLGTLRRLWRLPDEALDSGPRDTPEPAPPERGA